MSTALPSYRQNENLQKSACFLKFFRFHQHFQLFKAPKSETLEVYMKKCPFQEESFQVSDVFKNRSLKKFRTTEYIGRNEVVF